MSPSLGRGCSDRTSEEGPLVPLTDHCLVVVGSESAILQFKGWKWLQGKGVT